MRVSDYVQDTDFLKAQHLIDWNLTSAIVTIEAVEYVTFPASEIRPEESKFVISLEEVENRLPLNKTNLRFLTAQFGDETENWIGQKIVLNVVDVQNPQGGQVKGIRITALPQETKLPGKTATSVPPHPVDERNPLDERDPFAEDAPAKTPPKSLSAMTR